ncbi:MAG: toll/interleukin-1 receptor domain-containing protein [Candidatus Binatia bacterium]
MADVFISYASEDRDRAAKLASALGERGWSVWWDRKIVEAFDQAIERELETARSVVVLWSIHSVESEWVKNEASVASERGVLVPALIDSVKLPLEFRRKQTADLISWDGDLSHSGFQSWCEGIVASMGSAAPQPPNPPSVSMSNGKRSWLLAAIVGVVIVVGLFAFAMRSSQTPSPGSPIDGSETSKRSESKSD